MAAKQRGRPTHALARRPIVQAPLAQLPRAPGDETRRAVGRTRDGAVILPVPPPVVEMPSGYGWGAKVGVANWETQLVDKLPADLAGGLPTIEQIEAELADEPPARPSATKPARQTRTGARRGK